MNVLIFASALVLVEYLLKGVLLWGVAKLFGGAQATYLRALGVLLGLLVLGLALGVPMLWLVQYQTVVLVLLFVLVQLAVAMGLYQKYFGLTRVRSFFAFVVFTLLAGAMAMMIAIPLRMFVLEAFAIPTNSMAPTLLGKHRVGECPECGGPLIISAADEGDPVISPFGPPPGSSGPEEGICRTCRHVGETSAIAAAIVQGDRVLVDKVFVQPQRWDLLVIRARGKDAEIFVKRLVGLPGETLELRDGELWIDGASAVYAPDMVGLVYSSNSASERPQFALGEGQTVTLGDDEYFVLGDYSTLSNDSRNFGPVRPHQIIGVATVVFWPPTSWRVVR